MIVIFCLVVISVVGIYGEGVGITQGDVIDSKLTRKFQHSIMQQNLQSIIMSIEERLRNLDTIYSPRSSSGVEETLEQFSRKLDKMESKLTHIETIIQLQMDKISDNISEQFLKEDINREHIKKKLNLIHENVNNRLAYNEIKLDTIGRSAYENHNFIRTKLQKFEDKITSRISEVEIAISDSIVSLEDAKDICALNGNTTNDGLSNTVEKTIRQYFTVLENKYDIGNKEIFQNIKLAEDSIKSSMNKSYEIIIDVEDNFNEFTNKIAEIGDMILDKTESIEKNTNSVAKSVNLTRNEIQNSFRAIMVQIGKQEKSKVPKDSSEILNEMDRKIENNFENVLLAQNIFLETCHRLQMDESQMENKIGDIFQKLLDTLDAKILVEAEDVKQISKVLKNVLSTKGKFIDNYDLLKIMEQMQKQLSNIENGVNETIDLSKISIENRNNITWALADIREVIKSNFIINKSMLEKFNNTYNMSTLEDEEIVNNNINCIFLGINCTKDIFQHNFDEKIIFKDDSNNKTHNSEYDFDIRTLMNVTNDNETYAVGSDDKPIKNIELHMQFDNESEIEEISQESDRVKSPINE